MSRSDNYDRDHRDHLERAVAEVLSDTLDDRQVEEAAARVWERLGDRPRLTGAAGPSLPEAAAALPPGRFPGCPDFGHQVQPYLRGELAPARALLLEDHARDCLPCRRALHAARQERAGQAAVALHEIVEAAEVNDVTGRHAPGPTFTWGPRRPPSSPAALSAGAAAWAGPADRFGPADPADPDHLAHQAQAMAHPRPRRLRGVPTWLAAAALVLLAVGLSVGLWRALRPGSPGARMARVETVDGGLYRVREASSVPVAAGDAVREGEQVRTAKGSRAVLRMNDGSRIEMAERAGLSLAAGRGGNTIDLERGVIIVQAARQRPHHLYVATADCLVSVTGTIFAVNHGTKGSRVSVVEGEVHVQMTQLTQTTGHSPGRREQVLHADQQVATQPNVAAVPVRQEVAWSRDAARYDALLAEVAAAGGAIDSRVQRPAPRNASRLLDLVPAGSLVYVALPNLAANLVETQQVLEQRLAESPVLQQWWSETLGSPANQQRFHDLVQEIGNVGRYLGDEVVVAAGPLAGDAAAAGPPVLLAEAAREAQLRATLEQEVASVNQRAGKTALVLLDRLPAAAAPGAGASGPLLVWVGQGLLVASPSAAQIAAVAANLQPGAANAFVGSSFHARLAQAYADGAGWLFAADLQRLVAHRRAHLQPAAPASTRLTDAMGLFDLEHFVVERHDVPAAAGAPAGGAGSGAGTETRAALTFSQPRRGIAAWLAAPAPMGSLGFFSRDANLVAAFVVKSPVALLDELLALSPELAADLAKAEAEHGFSLRDDLAAPLGGEIALGVDGPVLPNPSWQLVAEVYDPVRLQQTIARAVQQANAHQVAAGKPGVALAQEQDGGRTYYTITASQPPLEVHYLFADGYLVAAPTQAQLDHALAQRAAGTTLAASSRLRGLLGRDGQVNVSALFYQNLGPLAQIAGPLAAAAGADGRAAGSRAAAAAGLRAGTGGSNDGAAGAGTAGSQGGAGRGPGLGAFLLGGFSHGPSMLYAYAEADRIVFAGRSEAGPMGLNLETLAGFGGILGGMERAHGAAMRGRGGS